MLYFTPGLFATQVIRLAYTGVVLNSLRSSLFSGNKPSPIKFAIYVVIEMLSVAIICPLEVMAAKLAIQRNHSDVGGSDERELGDDVVEAFEYAEESGQEEDVIR